MTRRTAKEHAANHERWLVSYADFITLLFAFFVVMYAISSVDAKKMKQVAHSIQQAFNVAATAGSSTIPVIESEFAQGLLDLPPALDDFFQKEQKELQSLGETIQEALQQATEAKKLLEMVHTFIDERGLVLSLSAKHFFDSGKAVLRPEVLPIIDQIADILKPLDREIRIEGHTDNVPISTALYPSNWELSAARATHLIKYLVDRFRFPPPRLSAVGYAEFRPIASNSTEEGRAHNRRVDIVVLFRKLTPHFPSSQISPVAVQEAIGAGQE